MSNIQFAILNLSLYKRWKLIMKPSQTATALISYSPCHQIFVQLEDGIDEKFCAVFDNRNKVLHMYRLHVASDLTWDGKHINVDYHEINGIITEVGIIDFPGIQNIYYLPSIVFPIGSVFYTQNVNHNDYHSYFFQKNDKLLIQLELFVSHGNIRVIKIDTQGVHFLIRVLVYQNEKRFIQKYLFDTQYAIFEKFYYAIFDFTNFLFIARTGYKCRNTVFDCIDPENCDILVKSHRNTTKYFVKSSQHTTLISLKPKNKVPNIVKSITLY